MKGMFVESVPDIARRTGATFAVLILCLGVSACPATWHYLNETLNPEETPDTTLTLLAISAVPQTQAYLVTGTVRDAFGNPLANAAVQFSQPGGVNTFSRFAEIGPIEVVTDASGRFEARLSVGNYQMIVIVSGESYTLTLTVNTDRTSSATGANGAVSFVSDNPPTGTSGGTTATVPSVPTGVAASPGDTQVTVSWTAVTGATSYNIYWGTAPGVSTSNGTQIAGVTSAYVHTGRTNGTAYYYVVTAANSVGESGASAEVNATPSVPLPGAPTGLAASPGDTQVTVTWSPVGGATSYNIYWSTSPGVTTASGTQVSGATSPHIHGGLVNGTTYYYIVTAVNMSGESAASIEANATPQVPVPGAPTGVAAAAGNSQVTVSWNPVGGATAYNIYWSTTSGVTTGSGTQIAGVTSPHIHSGLASGTTYYYIVTAVNAGGESTASSEVGATASGPGQLDVSFNGGGFVVHGNAAGGNGPDYGAVVAVDGSGRIVVAGHSLNASAKFDLVVWRYNADGTPDTTFNGSGFVVIQSYTGAAFGDIAKAVAIDGSGRILVAGVSGVNANGWHFLAVWRLNSNGSFDTTFDSDGKAAHSSLVTNTVGQAIAFDSSGRIVVAGQSGDGDMIVCRFNTNGSPDTTFNGSGFVSNGLAAGTSVSPTANQEVSVAVDSSDKIVVAGSSNLGPTQNDLKIWRINVNGTLDASFNGTGIVAHHNAAGGNGVDGGYSVVIDGSSRIVVSGSSRAGSGANQMTVWRYGTDGTLDTTFNGTGFYVDAAPSFHRYGRSLAIDGAGRIVVGGHGGTVPAAADDVLLWRINSDGTPDSAFGAGGLFSHNGAAGALSVEHGWRLALDANARIVVVGYGRNLSGNDDMVIWRVHQ